MSAIRNLLSSSWLALALALPGCCLLADKASSSHKVHKLTECGVQLKLPEHFGKPQHSSGCSYEWTANAGETTLRIQSALPGDKGQSTQKKRAMPGQTVDYARKAKYGSLDGREMRTQEKLGPKNRAVWNGFVKAPKGALTLKVIMLQDIMTADEFGESFWKNVRSMWLEPL